MGVFRSVGKGIGHIGGGLIGGTVKLTGKAVRTKWSGTGKWMEEVGDSIHSASKIALDNAGQFVDGAVEGTYGIIKKDEFYKQKGKNDLKDSTGRTLKGIGSTFKYTGKNAADVYKGVKSGNQDQTLDGIKNMGKVVIVSGLAIGVLDVIDGADTVEAEEIDTRNDHLNGTEHPDTGVPFVEKTVELQDGNVINGTFPVIDSTYDLKVDESLYYESDATHFSIANDMLFQEIQANPALSHELGLSSSAVQELANGQTPEGYTWHHNEEPGVLQLVDEEIHEQTAHTGGRSIWGGGSNYR